VFIPRLQNIRKIVSDDRSDLIEFFRREPVVAAQHNWLDPKLADIAFAPDMHVFRFKTVKAVKERTEGSGNSRNVGMTVPSSPATSPTSFDDFRDSHRSRQWLGSQLRGKLIL
jgi:hypothetical protein